MSTEGLRPAALRSGAFRFAMVLAAVFAAGSTLLLWVVATQVGRYTDQATEAMLQSEATILSGEYRQLGLSGLTDAIERHSLVKPEPPFRYLLFDSRRGRLCGDLPLIAAHVGRGAFTDREPDGQIMEVERLGIRLTDSILLVVATDTFDIAAMQNRLLRFTILSGLGISLFALVGGAIAGRLFLRRLDRVNHTVERIIEGNGNERLPAIGVGPEFDMLTRNLNRMLDRNAAAMEGLRQVSTAIAHDLRTPLMRLRHRIEGLREATLPDAGIIDGAMGQIDDILSTFQALLRIGMLEGGVGRQRFVPVNLSELLDRLCQVYDPVAEDGGHLFAADLARDIMVEGDADLLAQLFTNIIENAIVHTPQGTTIRCDLDIQGKRAVVRISDDGPGVPPEERERIFRRFYRRDASRNTPGAGLGLSLVAAIADLHGADYHVPQTERGFCIEIGFGTSG